MRYVGVYAISRFGLADRATVLRGKRFEILTFRGDFSNSHFIPVTLVGIMNLYINIYFISNSVILTVPLGHQVSVNNNSDFDEI